MRSTPLNPSQNFGNNSAAEKAKLRLRFKELATEFFATHDAAALDVIYRNIAAKLSHHLQSEKKTFKRVAIYEPMRYELPIREIVAQVPELRKAELLVPQWHGENMWFDAEPDLIIVPGLLVDKAGNRLGRGKGYYDRYLADSDATCIFLGYSFQVIEAIPAETHDRKIDTILTA